VLSTREGDSVFCTAQSAGTLGGCDRLSEIEQRMGTYRVVSSLIPLPSTPLLVAGLVLACHP
jgi:hypothetical protein